MRMYLWLAAALGLAAVAEPAFADSGVEAEPGRLGFEVNVLWPFFPGGISEFRLLVPILEPESGDFRGELVLGTYADFAHRIVREKDAAKTGVLAAKLGYRQFAVYGLHLEATVNAGWRRETDRPDGVTFDAFQARLWLLGGWQYEVTRDFYFNVRGGLGTHLYRSDRFADEERIFVAGADLNLGVRF